MDNSIVNYSRIRSRYKKIDAFSRNILHTLSLHRRYLTIHSRTYTDMKKRINFTYGSRNYTLRTLRMNFLGRGSAPRNASNARCKCNVVFSNLCGILPRREFSSRHNRSGKTRTPRATRWLRALLRAVYRNDGDTHGTVTSGSCFRRRVFDAAKISHGSSRRGRRHRLSESRMARALYSIITSRSVTSIRSIDRECEKNVHSERTRRKAS